MLDKAKNYLSNIGICDDDMNNMDQDELCELAIHYLSPCDLSEFLKMAND